MTSLIVKKHSVGKVLHIATTLSRNFGRSSRSDKKVAVVLSGNGVFDGTEVHEAAACLAAITRRGAEPVICAPDMMQAHVLDHLTGQEMSEKRNVRVESARIARGLVHPLSEVSSENQDAVIFPGGFGAAKNLCDFGFKGADMTVNAEVIKILQDFQQAKKPIGLCCIAPIIAAKVFGGQGVKLTLGWRGDEELWPHCGAIDVAKGFGANMMEMSVAEICVDSKLRIVTTPAYMYNGKFHEIQDGVTKMVNKIVDLM